MTKTMPFSIKTRSFHAFAILLGVVLGMLVSACSSPVDPLAEQPSVQTSDATAKTLPVLEVTYFMWSEKGIASEVDVSMWVPEEGFQKTRIALAEGPMEHTFHIHPDQYRDVDFTLYNRTEGSLVRAMIQIEGRVVALGHATGPIPLASLDARAYEAAGPGLVAHLDN